MPTFAQIYDAYRASPASNRLSLGEFAKLGEFYTGDPGFSTASGGLVDQALKRGSYWLDKGVEATGAPALTGEIGSRLYGALGLEESAGREVGRGLPRMAANLLPLAIPGVGPVAAIGSSAALSGVDAYEKSDSLGSAATAAASVPVSLLGAGLATQGLSKVLGMSAPAIAQTFLGRLGLYGAENVGATAAGEAFQVATGGEMPTFDKEYLAQTALESLPFAAADVKTLFTKPAMPTVPATAREEPSVSGSKVDTENVEVPAARPVNPMRAELDSVMEEFNLIDAAAEVEKQTILATVPEGAEREAELLKLNKRTRQKLMQIEEPEEISVELPTFEGVSTASVSDLPNGLTALSWDGGDIEQARADAEAQGFKVSSTISTTSGGVTKNVMKVWKKAPAETPPAVAELPVNVVEPELQVNPLADISLVHHTTDPNFALADFDTAKQTYTPELGKGVYLDPGSGWADHVEEMRGKPSRALPAKLKPGARLFKGTIEEAQRDYQNSDQYDAALIYLPNGKLDQVHVKNLSMLDSSAAPEAVALPVAAEPPAQVLTPPVEKVQVTAKAVAELNKVRMAAKLPPISIADARAALDLQMKAFPEKGTRELMEDWLTANMPRRVEAAERQQQSLTDATRAGSVEVRNDPGKNKFTRAHDYAMREVELLSKADPASEDGMLWAELGKVRPELGVGWLSAPEELIYAKNKGRANEMSTAQKRAVSYLMASIMEAKRGDGIWRKGKKGEVNLNSLSPDALARLIFEQASNRANSFKTKEGFVPLDDPDLNAAAVEFEISATPEERAAAEAVNESLVEADISSVVDPETIQETATGDPLGLSEGMSEADASSASDALVRRARRMLGDEVGNLNLAWSTRVKSQFTAEQRAQMAESLGVPETKLAKALVDGIDFVRGSDGRIRALVPEALQAGGGFEFGLGRIVDGKLGKHTLQKNKTTGGYAPVTTEWLRMFGGRGGQPLKAYEIEWYKELVPEAFSEGKVDLEKLEAGLARVNESIKVVTYGQDGQASEAKQQLDKLTHDWYDNLDPQVRSIVDNAAYNGSVDSPLNNLARRAGGKHLEALDQDKLSQFIRLTKQVAGENQSYSGPRATSYYNQISPFDTKKFPPIRIDVVLPKRLSKTTERVEEMFGRYALLKEDGSLIKHFDTRQEAEEALGEREATLNRKESNNTLWRQDDLHENLPNTLGWAMVQFVPDPKTGEPVMFVGELQSRWSQETFARAEALKKGEIVNYGHVDSPSLAIQVSFKNDFWSYSEKELINAGWDGKTPTKEWAKTNAKRLAESVTKADQAPLLSVHQNLILKAVIKEAQKRGITKVAISDAETAMMTEKHDTSGSQVGHDMVEAGLRVGDYVYGKRNEDGELVSWSTGDKTAEALADMEIEDGYSISQLTRKDFVSQDGGMRLSYDTTLPSIMKKLVGEGEIQDFGVHKNAEYGGNDYAGRPASRTETFTSRDAAEGHVKAMQNLELGSSWRVVELGGNKFTTERTPKGSPVFRNPDGTPKTNATGRAYDISNARGDVGRLLRDGGPVEGRGTLGAQAPTFDALFTQVMRKSGEHDDTIMAMLPKVREIGKLWSLDDVRFGELVNDVMGDAPVAGMATISGPIRKMWLAARKAGLGGADKVENLLAVAAHEAGHLAEQLYNSNAMREMDRAKYESAQRWKESATPEEMRETLEVAVETLLPKKWRKLKEVQDMLTHTNKDEILASLHGVWAMSKLEGVKDLSLLGALMPAQPRGFLEVITRIARRAMRGLRGVFYGTKSHDAHSALKQLTNTFESIEWGIRKSNEDIAAARAFLDLGVDSLDEMRTSSLRVAKDKSVPLSVNEFARLMVPESDVANRQGGVWKAVARAVANFIEPMSRVAEAHPKLKEVAEALLNVSGDAHNNLRRIMNPLYGDSDPVTGAHKSMPKAIREVMDIAHNDKDANKLIADVLLWEASNPGKQIDFSAASGPGQDLTRTWRELPEKKRNAVSDYLARAKKSNLETQQIIVDQHSETGVFNIARKLARAMPGLYDTAPDIVRDLLTAMRLGDAGLADQASQISQSVRQRIPDAATWIGVLESAQAHHKANKELSDFFAKRPSFQSYMRLGEFVVNGFDANGTQVYNALPARDANEVARIERKLQTQGIKTQVKQTTRGARFGLADDVQAMLESIDDRLMRKLNDAFGDKITEAEFEQFKSEFSLSGQLRHSTEVHSKFNPTKMGRSLAGASGIDAVEQRRQGARLIANSLAKQRAGAKLSYWKNHPKLRTMDMIPQVDKLSQAWQNYQIDDNATAAGIAQFAGVYHLGFNLPNMVAETLQPFTTVLSQATAQYGAVAATRGIAGVLKDVVKYYVRRFAGITRANEEFSKWHDNDERLMLTTLRDQGYFSRTLYNEGLDVDGSTTLAKDLQTGKKPWGIGSMAQNLGNNVMRMYELFTRHNTRIASVLGYRLARKDGADHEAAVQAAKRFVETGAYVGSRATRSLGLYGESTRGLGQLAHVLQGYNFSFLSQAARHLQRGWLMDNKQLESYGFTEADRAKARQASLMLFGTQFAAAGALGLPFAGAMTALFEKMTGQDVKASLYQWFAQQFEDDQEQGGEAADMLMRGFANTVIGKAGLPIDLGSRFAVGGLPGMSEMSGFDAGSVFGPVGGLVKTAFGAGGKASQGDFAGAATDLLPPSVRKLFDLLQHGDMTDKNKNLMGLDEREKAMYALGITPDRVRKLRDFENMVDSVSMARLRKTNKIEAELAEMLDEADPVTLRNALREKADELDMSPKALGAKVAALKLKLSMPKDFRSVPTAQDSGAASSLAAALGVSFGPSREREKAQLESQIRARLGLGPLGMDRMLEARRRERLALESPLDAYQSLE